MKATDRYFVQGVSCILNGQAMPVANLSVGGLFAATSHPPLEGQVLSLGLSLKGRPPFPIVGRVTWINTPRTPRARGLPQGFGVKIMRIALADKLALVDLLKRSKAEPRGARRHAR